jgi:outer membrane protein TolC
MVLARTSRQAGGHRFESRFAHFGGLQNAENPPVFGIFALITRHSGLTGFSGHNGYAGFCEEDGKSVSKTGDRRGRLFAMGTCRTWWSSTFFCKERQMAGTPTTTGTANRCIRLAACLALVAVLSSGIAIRSARGQVPESGPRAIGPGVGTNSVAGGVPTENPEVISIPIPLSLPLPQDAAPAENQEVISFSRTIALVTGQNPQIAFANERINESFAELKGARVLWLPSIQAGVNYQNHEGPEQNSNGTITAASRSALEAGLGMYAVGGGAPAIPGVTAKFSLADAVFQPRIAGQQVAVRQQAATATTHDFLLFGAVAYLDLLRAYQQQAIAQETLDHAEQLAQLTAAFARSGQGSAADADRAQTELALRRNALAQAAAQAQVASARLVEVLHLPPNCSLRPEEPTLVPIELVSHEATACQLVEDGLSHRPEVAESRHLVAEAGGRLDRERYAPLMPNVLLDASQGGFGGGPGSAITDFAGRFDFDATVYWQLRNFGLGDAAAREGARSRLEQARLIQVRLVDQVSREITEAHAQSQSLRGQIAVAEAGIRVAGDSYRRNLERIRGGQGLPLEVLQSIQALDQSRREYLRAVGDYDEWQFRLYRALGCPIPGEPGFAR